VAGPDQEGRPEIAVVCSTYRRPAQLRRLVRALETQTLDPSRFEVVLVDNAAGDTTATVIAELARLLAPEDPRPGHDVEPRTGTGPQPDGARPLKLTG
jgi:GT2 family glycosyltransferase